MQSFTKQFAAVVFGIWLALMICPIAATAQEKADVRQSEQDEISFYELEQHFMVTATKRKISVRKAPAIATVITADEIKNMGAKLFFRFFL